MSASLKDFRSDILLLVEKSKISKDFRILPRHVDFLIAKYRSIAIRQQYSKTLEIEPVWLQDQGPLPCTTVTSADDPIIPVSSVTLSRITIPTVAHLPGNSGIYRVASATKQITYYPTTQSRFFDFVQGSYRARNNYYFRVGTSLYVNSVVDYIDPILILDDPMEGTIFDTENQQPGDLIVGTLYVVASGTIVHNSVQYNVGQQFTAVNNTFITLTPFSGTVQLVNQVRPIKDTDPYPMGFDLWEMIMLKILTQDFKIEQSEIAEIRNDSQDQGTLIQGEQGK